MVSREMERIHEFHLASFHRDIAQEAQLLRKSSKQIILSTKRPLLNQVSEDALGELNSHTLEACMNVLLTSSDHCSIQNALDTIHDMSSLSTKQYSELDRTKLINSIKHMFNISNTGLSIDSIVILCNITSYSSASCDKVREYGIIPSALKQLEYKNNDGLAYSIFHLMGNMSGDSQQNMEYILSNNVEAIIGKYIAKEGIDFNVFENIMFLIKNILIWNYPKECNPALIIDLTEVLFLLDNEQVTDLSLSAIQRLLYTKMETKFNNQILSKMLSLISCSLQSTATMAIQFVENFCALGERESKRIVQLDGLKLLINALTVTTKDKVKGDLCKIIGSIASEKVCIKDVVESGVLNIVLNIAIYGEHYSKKEALYAYTNGCLIDGNNMENDICKHEFVFILVTTLNMENEIDLLMRLLMVVTKMERIHCLEFLNTFSSQGGIKALEKLLNSKTPEIYSNSKSILDNIIKNSVNNE